MAMTGGEKLQDALNKIAANLASAGQHPSVKIGFLAGSSYPDGTSVPMVAAIQEFGGTINREARQQTIYRRKNAAGTAFLRKGRFVKKAASNFSSTHAVGAYSITIPPRPYFRTMIRKNGPNWGAQISKLLKATEFDTAKTLGQMGMLIKGQLQDSIRDLTSPPLAPSTIRAKGFSKPLIDTGVMLNSVDFAVST